MQKGIDTAAETVDGPVLPDGQNTQESVNPHLKKYSDLQKVARRSIFLTIPSHQKGVRDRHGRGAGMRWTRKVRRTSALEADGEDVWARHPDAGVKFAAQALRMTVAKSPVAEVSTI